VPIHTLLASGGDERCTVDPSSGRNRYGCAPRPEPEVAAWSSCTASTPSPRAYQAASDLLERCSSEGEELRAALLELVGLSSDEVDVVFMPSGTDAELIPLALLLAEGSTPVANILVAEGELGSSTSLAAQALHCASTSPSSGTPIAKGSAVPGFPPGAVTLRPVRIRNERGELRAADAVEREVTELVWAARARGERVLLHLVDASKTGIRAPSPELVDSLVDAAPDGVRVVVDAAQGRLGDRELGAYLARGFLVIFSASKFYAGPCFSGAVLVPRRTWSAPRDPLPTGLQHYLSRCAVPRRWPMVPWIEAPTNAGLLLRWAAGLAEMRAYRQLRPRVRRSILVALGAKIAEAARRFPSVELLDEPPREPAHPDDDGLSALPTIFTFKLRAGAGVLDLAEARRVRERMAEPCVLGSSEERALGVRQFLLGQAVELSPSAAALRVAISAPHVIAAAEHARQLPELADELVALFGKLDLLVRATMSS
jgi:hypothetical protein